MGHFNEILDNDTGEELHEYVGTEKLPNQVEKDSRKRCSASLPKVEPICFFTALVIISLQRKWARIKWQDTKVLCPCHSQQRFTQRGCISVAPPPPAKQDISTSANKKEPACNNT